MGLIAWIIVGLIAGIIAKGVMPGESDEPNGLLGTIGLGIVGAILGGFLSGIFFGGGGVNGLNLSGILTSVVGACLFIGLLRLIRRR